jgi:murein L,D-transpeptidase YcbB/YkuD
VAQIEGVRFNPNWTVPPTIKRKDYLPKLKDDPSYLSQKGIQLVKAGRTIDPQEIDWADLSAQELSQIRMVQPPGEKNALGQYRVLMPNPHNIYLHDTNQKSAFDEVDRAISSGCVRLSDPKRLAEFLVSPEPKWTKERLEATVSSGKMRDVRISDSIPVYLFYYTVWLDTRGDVVFGSDIYGRDSKLLALLKDQNGLPEL